MIKNSPLFTLSEELIKKMKKEFFWNRNSALPSYILYP